MGVKFEALKMMFEMQKTLEQCIYIYINFENKNCSYLSLNFKFSPPSFP
jgi:hypothetical protein